MINDTFDSPVVQIPLTKGYVAIVDAIDADLAQFKWNALDDGNAVYARRMIQVGAKRVTQLMHRVILERKLNRPLEKGEVPDHKDHQPLNNRRSNLRPATRAQNVQNSKLNTHHTTSGYKGVSYNKRQDKWIAYITADGKRMSLGCFNTPELAARAYNKAAILYHGDFACLNSIDEDILNTQIRDGLEAPRVKEKKQPARERGPRANNTSGYKGVKRGPGGLKWIAEFRAEGRRIHLGCFADILDAVRAYNAGAIKYFGDAAYLNPLPDEGAE